MSLFHALCWSHSQKKPTATSSIAQTLFEAWLFSWVFSAPGKSCEDHDSETPLFQL